MTATNGSNERKRPSAMKRYGPLIAIVVVVAIVIAAVAIASGGSSDNKKSSSNNSSSGSTDNGVVMINDSNRDSVDWGPNCDTKTGRVKIPLTYAPPCVKPFTGNNGGSTSSGVTKDSVKVVVYIGDPKKNPLQAATVENAGANLDTGKIKQTYRGYSDLFQKYYETYGRKVDLQFFDGTGSPMDEVAARADAKAIAAMHPFAVLNGANQTPAWADEITAHHIMCLGLCSLAVPEDFIKPRVPYLFSVGPTPEQGSLLTAKLVTNLLAGHDAQYAGSKQLQSKKRVFGVVHYDTVDGQQRAPFAALKNALAAKGVKIAVDIPFNLEPGKSRSTEIAKLKQAGVTTVIYTGDPLTPTDLTKAATAQNYFPEWVLGSNVLADISLFGRTFDQQQWKHMVGLSLNRARTDQNARESYFLYQWQYGTPPPNNTYDVIISDLLPFWNGLPLAGPNLTPETFKDGMFNAPIAGGTPLNPAVSRGHHGLWPGTDWGGSDDTGLLWWNPDAVGEDEVGHVGKGLYEFVDNGQRWTLGTFPTSNPGFFDKANSITIYKTIPPEMAPPHYPSPAKQ